MAVATKQLQSTTLRHAAHVLTGAKADYDPLMALIGEAHFVLIGDASHGTHEFNQQRAEITKRLIQEKGFRAVAVEADWPDPYRINRYVRGADDGGTAVDSLEGFERFPTWMWQHRRVGLYRAAARLQRRAALRRSTGRLLRA